MLERSCVWQREGRKRTKSSTRWESDDSLGHSANPVTANHIWEKTLQVLKRALPHRQKNIISNDYCMKIRPKRMTTGDIFSLVNPLVDTDPNVK